MTIEEQIQEIFSRLTALETTVETIQTEVPVVEQQETTYGYYKLAITNPVEIVAYQEVILVAGNPVAATGKVFDIDGNEIRFDDKGYEGDIIDKEVITTGTDERKIAWMSTPTGAVKDIKEYK